jgi:hypothetical protein
MTRWERLLCISTAMRGTQIESLQQIATNCKALTGYMWVNPFEFLANELSSIRP